jgi:phospholipid/cholesterol/gamma-HCH transport system substrate-binding protein
LTRADVRGAIAALLEGGQILDDLDILTPAQLEALLDGSLEGVTGQLPGGLRGGSGPSTGTSGGSGLGGVLGGTRGRAVPGEAFRTDDAQQIDPFGLARLGFDPGVGTLLLQGVATNR